MDFLSQIFTFQTYYLMVKQVFDNIGYDYYKGLKYKLPPIRYIGKNILNEELVILVHPKDFINKIKDFKIAYNNISNNNENENERYLYNIENKKSEVYEIYPSIKDLIIIPNGFLALFVNEYGMNILINEFNKNEEINNLKFIKINSNGLILNNINISGVLEIFINKLNKNKSLLEKYNNLYLVIGELNDIDIILGKSIPTNKFNIIGGKRLYNENSLQSTIRECIEELGLKENSKIANIIKIFLPISKNIIKCKTFNIYCIYFTPTTNKDYDIYIKNNINIIDTIINSNECLININEI